MDTQIITKAQALVNKQKKDPLQEEVFEKYKHLAYMMFLTATLL